MHPNIRASFEDYRKSEMIDIGHNSKLNVIIPYI
jgi:hypothetical protein